MKILIVFLVIFITSCSVVHKSYQSTTDELIDNYILDSIAVLSESQFRLHQTGNKSIQPIPPSKSI